MLPRPRAPRILRKGRPLMTSGRSMRIVAEREPTAEEMEALPPTALTLEPPEKPLRTDQKNPEPRATQVSTRTSSRGLTEAQGQALFGTVRAIAMILNARLLLLLTVLGDFFLCWSMPTQWVTLGVYQVAVILLVGLNWSKG